jgi:hypothetical protein
MTGVIPEEERAETVDGDLARLGMRTSLMALNLLLATVPPGPVGFHDAAAEARILSRRVASAADDFKDVMRRAG